MIAGGKRLLGHLEHLERLVLGAEEVSPRRLGRMAARLTTRRERKGGVYSAGCWAVLLSPLPPSTALMAGHLGGAWRACWS